MKAWFSICSTAPVKPKGFAIPDSESDVADLGNTAVCQHTLELPLGHGHDRSVEDSTHFALSVAGLVEIGEKAVAAHAVETKIRDAVRSGLLGCTPGDELVNLALDARIITEDERQTVLDADEARAEVIQVDTFDPETFL